MKRGVNCQQNGMGGEYVSLIFIYQRVLPFRAQNVLCNHIPKHGQVKSPAPCAKDATIRETSEIVSRRRSSKVYGRRHAGAGTSKLTTRRCREADGFRGAGEGTFEVLLRKIFRSFADPP